MEFTMTVRKNFIFDEDTAEHLEKIAEKEGKNQSQVVRDLIEDKYESISVEERLEALHAFAGSSTGLFGDLTIQKIKASRDI